MVEVKLQLRRPIRWRWILVPLALLVAGGAGAWIGIVALYSPERLHRIVVAQVTRSFARPVQFGAVSLGLWPPVRLTVQDAALAEPGGFANGMAFQARAVHLDLDLYALLERRLIARAVTLDEPRLHLVQRADGTTNLDSLLKPAPPGRAPRRPMDLAVRDLSLRDGHVMIDDLRAARRSVLHLSSKISISRTHRGARVTTSGSTTLSGLARGPLTAATEAQLDRSLEKLQWKIDHDGIYHRPSGRLDLRKLKLGLGSTSISMAGVVERPGAHARYDLRARGSRVDLGQLLGFLGKARLRALEGLRGSGRLDFDVRMNGVLGAGQIPATTGTLRVANGAFRYPGARAGIEAASFSARLRPDWLGIDDFSGRVAGQALRGRLTLARFRDPWVTFNVRGGLDLGAIAPGIAPRDTKLSGHADVDLAGRGPARDPGSIALEGLARFAGVRVESPRFPKAFEGLQGIARFAPGRASVNGLSGRTGSSSFTLDGSIARPLALLATPGSVAPASVNFTFRSPHVDGMDLVPTGSGAGAMNASGGGRVQIARFRHQGLDATNLAAQVRLAPGEISVPDFSFNDYGGTATGSARLTAAGPSFNLHARANALRADELLGAWTGAGKYLSSALDLTMDVAGQGRNAAEIQRSLAGNGVAVFLEGTLGPAPFLDALARFTRIPALSRFTFRETRMPFVIRQGRIFTEQITLIAPNGEWKLSGSTGFDGTLDYAVSTTIPRQALPALSHDAALVAGAFQNENGDLLLDLRVRGNARSPRISWDPRAMRNRLMGRVSTLLAEQRAGIEEQIRNAAMGGIPTGVIKPTDILDPREILRNPEKILRPATPDTGEAGRVSVEQARQVMADSLQKRARGLLKSFFNVKGDTIR